MSHTGSEWQGAERRQHEALLKKIVDHVADGIVIVNSEGSVRFVNPAAEALFGRTAEELLDQPFGFPLVADGREEIDVVARNRELLVAELRVVEMEWEDSPAHLVSLRDITDRKESEERQQQLVLEQIARERAEAEERKFRFLADAGTVLDSSLDYHEVLNHLARLVVSPNEELHSPAIGRPTHPRLADWCAVDIVDESGDISRVAAVHHDPDKQEWMDELVRRFPPDWSYPYPATRAIESGEAVLHADLNEVKVREMSRSAEHAELLVRLGTGSVIAVPLLTRGSAGHRVRHRRTPADQR